MYKLWQNYDYTNDRTAAQPAEKLELDGNDVKREVILVVKTYDCVMCATVFSLIEASGFYFHKGLKPPACIRDPASIYTLPIQHDQ